MMKVAGNSEDKKLKKYGVNELRRMFLEFFESKGHLAMKSFSLVPHNDNSLLLINSGTVSYTHLDVYKRQGRERVLERGASGELRTDRLCASDPCPH